MAPWSNYSASAAVGPDGSLNFSISVGSPWPGRQATRETVAPPSAPPPQASEPVAEPVVFADLVPRRTVPSSFRGKDRYYVIFRATDHTELEGIYLSPWSFVELLLPAPTLDECRGVSLKGFDTSVAALEAWATRRPNTPPVRQA